MLGGIAGRLGRVAVSLCYGGLLVFLRGGPSLAGDSGIFLSVAARVLYGDRLYADVYDNKDPLFFYAHAIALAVGGWRGPFALDALWLAIAAMSIAGLLRSLGASPLTAVVGFLVYPLFLTGTWYYAGFSMLAALSLAPLVGWLWLTGHCGWAGAVIGVALLLKINLILVLVAAPVALLVVHRSSVSVRRALVIGASGLGTVLGLAAVVLAVRGELGPYIDMLRDNVSYATDVLVYTGRAGGIAGHMRAAAQSTPHVGLVVLFFALGGAIAVRALVRARDGATTEGAMAGIFLLASAGVAITLALTAAWDHHVQMLAFPGALLVTLLVTSVEAAIRSRWLRLAGWGAVLAAGFILLGGAGEPPGASGPLSRWWTEPHSFTALALESAATRYLPGPGPISYAHLGQNDEQGHAAFLDGRFRLDCP
jgi:hypothetical protein